MHWLVRVVWPCTRDTVEQGWGLGVVIEAWCALHMHAVGPLRELVAGSAVQLQDVRHADERYSSQRSTPHLVC